MNRLILSAPAIVGETVHNPAGEALGKIEDVMLDAELGRIAYVVLSFGGRFGLGEKLFAVPWEAMRTLPAKGGDGWFLVVDRSLLARAPGFERGNWPNFADPQFATDIYSHYGVPPYWEVTRDLQ
jgi:sporulation protein YlmC with PRC-barrel domain